MTEAEYVAFLKRVIPEYAEDKVRAGLWTGSEALEKSRKEYEEQLPQGLQSKNHFFYTLYDGDQPVGMIWVDADLNHPSKKGFIYELYVDEKQRGKGYGKQAMLLFEEKARELGLKTLGLHVFGVNRVARNLYESLGYETVSLKMNKVL